MSPVNRRQQTAANAKAADATKAIRKTPRHEFDIGRSITLLPPRRGQSLRMQYFLLGGPSYR